MTTVLISKIASITPTRRLRAKERGVFEKVLADFIHFTPADAEMLTRYAESVVRYEVAEKSTRRNPTISVPVVNRSTGNVTGDKVVRNPAYATLKEAQAQMNSLARRLMIDPASSEKRQRLLTKKARALAASEAAAAASQSAVASLTEFEIQAKIDELRKIYIHATEDTLRTEALWYLTVCDPLLNEPTEDCPDLYAQLS